jgi:hypothetical protein
MSSRFDTGRVPARAGREFPTLGSSRCLVAPGTQAPYFVTGPFARTDHWSSPRVIGFVHAKVLGTSVTLCGISTGSWETRWDVQFDPQQLHGACAICRTRVSAEPARAV